MIYKILMIGIILFSGMANSATVPSIPPANNTPTQQFKCGPGAWMTTENVIDACVAIGGKPIYGVYAGYCYGGDPEQNLGQCQGQSIPPPNTCPSGYTLDPNGTTCSNNTVCPTGYHNQIPDEGQCIKDCVGQQQTSATGVCTCEQKSLVTVTTSSAFNASCVGGCSVSWGAAMANPVDVAKYLAKAIPLSAVASVAFVRQSGATCEAAPNLVNVTLAPLPQDTSGKNAAGTAPDPLNKPETNQSPEACAGVGGSYGVVNGKSVCLTDKGNSMQKLTVDSNSKVTTNPDNSSSTTTENKVTAKDPLTGEVKTRIESTTVTKDAAGNITGTGTVAVEGNTRDSDLCSKNPGLQICKGGMSEEATQVKVLAQLSTDGVTNDAITTAVVPPADKQEADDAFQAITDKLTANNEANAAQASFRDSLTTWFDPIPSVTCSPYVVTISGKSWTWDYCPIAHDVSQLMAYGLWVMLAFGSLSLITRKAE